MSVTPSPSLRSALLLALAWTLASPGPTAAATAKPAERARPNILLAIADDWGWPHAGAYGDPAVRTPTFDRVAAEGVLFEHAYVSSPSCTPSRAAVLTGQWHWRLEESANLWSTLRKDIPVYPDLLEAEGYSVGFERKGWGPGKIEVGGRTRNPAGDRFESFEAFLAARPDGQPFVYWFGSTDPHRPYDTGSGRENGIQLDRIELFPHFPDALEVRSDVADYYAEVQRFDGEVGQMLTLLQERGELERTVVVMTGDHGMPFPRCKSNLYDCGARVPLAIRGPGMTRGRVARAFVSLTDLAPTFLELGRVEVPEAMTGRSLLPLLGPGEPSPDELAARAHVIAGKERHVPAQESPDAGGTPMRSMRTRDFLYIRNLRPDRWPAGTPRYQKAQIEGAWLGDCDNGPTKIFMVENQDKDAHYRRLYDLSFARRPAEELYALGPDPDQLHNVAGDPDYAAVRSELAARLDSELRATSDPRVVGGGERLEAYPYYGGSPLWPGLDEKN